MVFFTDVRPQPGFGPFEVRSWVKFSKFLPGEPSDLYANGPESFPQGLFTHFRSRTVENYESVFLTVVQTNGALTGVRPKPGFGPLDRCATIFLSRYFWPIDATNGGGGVSITEKSTSLHYLVIDVVSVIMASVISTPPSLWSLMCHISATWLGAILAPIDFRRLMCHTGSTWLGTIQASPGHWCCRCSNGISWLTYG